MPALVQQGERTPRGEVHSAHQCLRVFADPLDARAQNLARRLGVVGGDRLRQQ